MAATALKIEVTSPSIVALLATGDDSLVGKMRVGAAVEVEKLLRGHFEQLEAERSGKVDGVSVGKGTHFWQEVADGLSRRTVGSDILIGIHQVGFRQRLQGGTITAGKNINPATGEPFQFLPIAVDQESYGKTPGDFPPDALKYVVLPTGGPALIMAENTERLLASGKNKGKSVRAKKGEEATHGQGSVMFLLRHSVTQEPDPSVLPSEADIQAAARKAADAAASVYLERGSAG